jgi:hypothetical protein
MDDFERIYLANLSSIALEDDLLENNNCFGLVFFPCNSLIARPRLPAAGCVANRYRA